MANILDCNIVGNEFEIQSRHHIYFRINPLGGKRSLNHELNIIPVLQ